MNSIAVILARTFEDALSNSNELLAVEPFESQQPARRELCENFWHADFRKIGKHQPIERRDFGFASIVELLAQPVADLALDFAGIDHRYETPMQRKHEAELGEVGFHRRRHVGILQLARDALAAQRDGAVHLAERSGRSRARSNSLEFRRQSGPSSACMRRRTNEAPIGGASDCSLINSSE